MTVAKTFWGTVRRPFEWALSLIREPALLALWVLVPIACAHAIAVVEPELPSLKEDYIMIDEFKKDISDWIVDWVSQYNDKIKNVPCPFAKQALVKDNIQWDFVSSEREMLDALYRFKLEKEIAVIGFHPDCISTEWLVHTVEKFNDLYKDEDLLVFEDHPHLDEILLGERMNQGTWGFLAIQQRSKLNRATQMLMAQGYYDNWPQENWDDVVSWRLDD